MARLLKIIPQSHQVWPTLVWGGLEVDLLATVAVNFFSSRQNPCGSLPKSDWQLFATTGSTWQVPSSGCVESYWQTSSPFLTLCSERVKLWCSVLTIEHAHDSIQPHTQKQFFFTQPFNIQCTDGLKSLAVQKVWGNQYHPQIISYTIQKKHNRQTTKELQSSKEHLAGQTVLQFFTLNLYCTTMCSLRLQFYELLYHMQYTLSYMNRPHHYSLVFLNI